jgi:hypothetical protein
VQVGIGHRPLRVRFDAIVTAVETRTDARRALLARLIDHAPLFPPASLPPDEALAGDRRAREGTEAWMLGRLVWPASRLGELGGEPRALSLVLDGPRPADPRVEAVELRWREDLDELEGEVYVELPLDDALPERIAALGRSGLRAKVRCGGEIVPPAEALARFVRTCREAGVVFKATAGLHHAVRSEGQHGFLNLLAAVVFADEERALTEEDAGAFALDADSFRWRDREAEPEEVARARRELFASIGSCSFAEPVDELRALGLL